MTPLVYQAVIALLLIALGVAVAAAVRAPTRRAARLTAPGPGLYERVKGRWPYVVGATAAVVTAAHSAGLLSDQTFATLLALHGSAAVPALRAALKHLVDGAVQRPTVILPAPPAPVAPVPPAPIPEIPVEPPTLQTPKDLDDPP